MTQRSPAPTMRRTLKRFGVRLRRRGRPGCCAGPGCARPIAGTRALRRRGRCRARRRSRLRPRRPSGDRAPARISFSSILPLPFLIVEARAAPSQVEFSPTGAADRNCSSDDSKNHAFLFSTLCGDYRRHSPVTGGSSRRACRACVASCRRPRRLCGQGALAAFRRRPFRPLRREPDMTEQSDKPGSIDAQPTANGDASAAHDAKSAQTPPDSSPRRKKPTS